MTDKGEIGLNIRKIRLQKDLTQEKLGILVNSNRATINRIENGKQGCTIDFLIKIADALDVPVHRLVSDELLVPHSLAEKEPAIIEVFSDDLSKIEYDKYRTQDDFVAIRLLEDEVSLGPGSEINAAKTKGYALIYKEAITTAKWRNPRENERYLCFKATGNSMAPTINDESLMVVDLQDIKPKKDKIYIIWLNKTNEVTTKRILAYNKEYIAISADNPSEPDYPMIIKLREGEKSPIRGRVIWTWNIL